MRVTVLLVATLVAAISPASELPSVEPESVGFSTERLRKITEFTQRQVAEGKHAGYVTMVARHGQVVHFDAVGNYGIDNNKPMDRDTLFRIFSMTKPVTAVAMMMLYEEGAFQMHDPVSVYLPELADMPLYKEGEGNGETYTPTIEQLFTHTAGLTHGWRAASDPVDAMYAEADLHNSKNLDEYISRLSKLPLMFKPGTRYHYGVGYDVLGAVVEKISGQSLDQFFRTRIFEPLDMHDTFFSVPEDKLDRLATNHYWNREHGQLMLIPEDRRRSYTDVTLFSGGGGLVSTAMDYMVFCEMLRNGGSFNGVRIIGPKTIQYMTQSHLTPEVRNNGATEFPESHLYKGQNYGLGFGVMVEPGITQVVSSAGEYSWGGLADTKFWIDPEEDLVAILMTQVMYPAWETRYQMKIATYQALIELGTD